VRALDAGGWSDTWFARHGVVCHLCVGPGAEVFARLTPRGGPAGRAAEPSGAEVELHVPDFDDRYSFSVSSPPGRHPLLEAALRRWAPVGCSLEVAVSSAVPAGSSLGTSAAVVVALITALQVLGGERAKPGALAHAAHDVETVDLARQSGVQDQIAAAFGGANLVHIAPYPQFDVCQLQLRPATRQALAERLVTVYMGTHDSSVVHNTVIDYLAGEGARLMEPLRAAARQAADALVAGDLDAYGDAATASTEAQSALHPTLISPLARRVIAVAARHGAAGWKVNGAGGPGGTISFIGPDDPAPLVKALEALAGLRVLPLKPVVEGAHIVDQG
jgi:D-glycero-alpha-D-manno-heptose-7-phosphate kinase